MGHWFFRVIIGRFCKMVDVAMKRVSEESNRLVTCVTTLDAA